jgi:hypothetical protein
VTRAIVIGLALAAAACFNPDYPVGLPCGPDSFCPSGQMCDIDNICVAEPGGGDVDGGDGDAGLGDLLSIDIGPDLTLPLNQTHTFVVTATYENGTAIADNAFVIWSSTDNGIVFVDFMGIARPQAEGTATVSANFNGRLDDAVITVVPAM